MRYLRLEVTVSRGGSSRQSVAEVSTLLELLRTLGLPRSLGIPVKIGVPAPFGGIWEQTLRILAMNFKFRVARMSVLLNTVDNSGLQSLSGNRACSLRVKASFSGVHAEPLTYIESRVARTACSFHPTSDLAKVSIAEASTHQAPSRNHDFFSPSATKVVTTNS